MQNAPALIPTVSQVPLGNRVQNFLHCTKVVRPASSLAEKKMKGTLIFKNLKLNFVATGIC